MKRTDRIGLIPQGLAALESEAIDFTELKKKLSAEIGSKVLDDADVEYIDEKIQDS